MTRRPRVPKRDQYWQDLVNDPEWDDFQGIDGFAFLDPTGFRYCLPAAIIRSIQDGYATSLPNRQKVDEISHDEWQEAFQSYWNSVDKVLVTCDTDNIASAKIIEKTAAS